MTAKELEESFEKSKRDLLLKHQQAVSQVNLLYQSALKKHLQESLQENDKQAKEEELLESIGKLLQENKDWQKKQDIRTNYLLDRIEGSLNVN